MKTWEYNFVPYEAATADEISDFLDAQGQEGWEVVSHTYDYEADGINVTFVLKREIPGDDEQSADEQAGEQNNEPADNQPSESPNR